MKQRRSIRNPPEQKSVNAELEHWREVAQQQPLMLMLTMNRTTRVVMPLSNADGEADLRLLRDALEVIRRNVDEELLKAVEARAKQTAPA